MYMSKLKETYFSHIRKIAELGKIPREEWDVEQTASYHLAILFMDVFGEQVQREIESKNKPLIVTDDETRNDF